MKKLINQDDEKWTLFGVLNKMHGVTNDERIEEFVDRYIVESSDIVPKKYKSILEKVLGGNNESN